MGTDKLLQCQVFYWLLLLLNMVLNTAGNMCLLNLNMNIITQIYIFEKLQACSDVEIGMPLLFCTVPVRWFLQCVKRISNSALFAVLYISTQNVRNGYIRTLYNVLSDELCSIIPYDTDTSSCCYSLWRNIINFNITRWFINYYKMIHKWYVALET